MPRRRRLHLAGIPHHVIQRGNNRSDIFRGTEDYELFLQLLVHATTRHPNDVHGYALMRTHVHVILTPSVPGAVARAMQVIGTRYAQYYNRRYGRSGALFEGRYRTTIIDNDDYWFTCMRYVELNPVRAGVVSRPDAYAWSSYGANALGLPDRVVTAHPLYTAIGSDPRARQSRWAEMCRDDIDSRELARIRYAIHYGEPVPQTRVAQSAPDQRP